MREQIVLISFALLVFFLLNYSTRYKETTWLKWHHIGGLLIIISARFNEIAS